MDLDESFYNEEAPEGGPGFVGIKFCQEWWVNSYQA